jgi:TPR repeat protein
MPISRPVLIGLAVGGWLGLAGPALAFDPQAPPAETTDQAFQHGLQAYREGDKTTAIEALQVAASQGDPRAQWKLGRMYAEGDGVQEDDVKAFDLFAQVANAYADESPDAPSAPFVADAFVALGSYYREGIPGSAVKANTNRAREMFRYAGSYFRDSDAQFNLARMYYEGQGGDPDPREAARWAKLSADKGNVAGQALLGHLLFEGEGVQRQPVLGLMFLTLARSRATPDQQWIFDMHEEAFSVATETERRTATALAEDWMEKNPDPQGALSQK